MLRAPKENTGLSVRRLLALFVAMAVVFGLYSVRLFYVQIVEGDKYASLADASTKTTISIAPTRGEILDCNQIPLVSNRTSYAVVLDYNFFPHGNSEEKQKEENDCLLALLQLLQEQGETWNDTMPISNEAPYTFLEKRESGIARMKSYLHMASYATAEDCMTQMVGDYALKAYSQTEQRQLAGIRYAMTAAGFGVTTPYTFASDISSETMYKLMENSDKYPGVDVETVAVREYVSGATACHVIGAVGPIYAEEYADLKEKGYFFNDIVGKSGIEAAAEEYLRGKAGKRTLTKSSKGTVLAKTEVEAPVPGQTVITTIDSRLQQKAQEALNEKILQMRASAPAKKGKDIQSGSVVVLDVKNNGVKVCASWPSYNLTTYSEDYAALSTDPDKPLFNRALYGAFPCGSTFKPGVALAAITEGKITPSTYINWVRTYTYYAPSYTPNCLGHHGNLNVVGAIQKSCNYYFYEVGRLMGSSLFSYLTKYGFGQKTGVEIGESAGVQQTPEYLQSIGSSWVAGDYLQLAIGQKGSYTPIQLAAYVSMIANGGVRYKTHFIGSLRRFDSTADTVIEPEVAATVEWSEAAKKSVKEGMIAVGKAGTAASLFRATPYTVACKTGTAQTGIRDSSDHGTFIAYAPADNPEVAIAVVMERGTSGAASHVARQVLDEYFSKKETGEAPTESGVLLP